MVSPDSGAVSGGVIKSFLDIFFPPVCPACEDDVAAGQAPLCRDCSSAFSKHLISSPLCTLCGVPFVSGVGEDRLCGECLMKEPPFRLARSAYVYKGGVLDAIHGLKYYGRVILAGPLGELLADCAETLPERPDLVVPVPLHKARLRSRGFNQALLLAKKTARRLSIRLDYLNLRRTVPTRPQVALSSRERRDNVKGVFAVKDPGAFSGRLVLLVDDVFTTGSTVRECAKVLKKAGAETIVLTLARAV